MIRVATRHSPHDVFSFGARMCFLDSNIYVDILPLSYHLLPSLADILPVLYAFKSLKAILAFDTPLSILFTIALPLATEPLSATA